MFARSRTSLMRAAPWALTAISRGSRPSMASTLVARSTTALLNLETQFSERQRLWQPEPPKLSLILAGTLGAVLYAEEPGADCAPKKRSIAAAPKPAAKKAAGPALTEYLGAQACTQSVCPCTTWRSSLTSTTKLSLLVERADTIRLRHAARSAKSEAAEHILTPVTPQYCSGLLARSLPRSAPGRRVHSATQALARRLQRGR